MVKIRNRYGVQTNFTAKCLLGLLLLLCLNPASHGNCIGVVTAGGGAGFWGQVEKGARQAGLELGIKVIVRGLMDEASTEGQRHIINAMISWGCKGLVLAPNSNERKQDVASLQAQGIPTVYIDRDIGGERISVIKTQNFQAGVLAGKEMAKALNGEGRVALLRMDRHVVSTTHRENGFVQGARAGGIEIQFEAYLGTTIGDARKYAKQAFQNMPGIVGIFTPNESTSIGTMLALDALQLPHSIVHIGFDAHELMIKALKDNKMHGFIVQRPFLMGYQGVQTAYKAMKGLNVEPLIDTGVKFISKNNLNQKETKEILNLN